MSYQKLLGGRYLSRDLRRDFQYLKLVNYFGDQLGDEWGGDFYRHHDMDKIRQGRDNFNEWISQQEHEFVRKQSTDPWGPEVCFAKAAPDVRLGYPLELYLGCGGRVLTLSQASRRLCVPTATLMDWKLELMLDHLVIGRVLEMMLNPRPTWASFVK